MDVDQFALATLTDDHREGVAAFLDRRKPRFRLPTCIWLGHLQSKSAHPRVA
jgi:hypothetical protein